jgi:hypothetical protein
MKVSTLKTLVLASTVSLTAIAMPTQAAPITSGDVLTVDGTVVSAYTIDTAAFTSVVDFLGGVKNNGDFRASVSSIWDTAQTGVMFLADYNGEYSLVTVLNKRDDLATTKGGNIDIGFSGSAGGLTYFDDFNSTTQITYTGSLGDQSGTLTFNWGKKHTDAFVYGGLHSASSLFLSLDNYRNIDEIQFLDFSTGTANNIFAAGARPEDISIAVPAPAALGLLGLGLLAASARRKKA